MFFASAFIRTLWRVSALSWLILGFAAAGRAETIDAWLLLRSDAEETIVTVNPAEKDELVQSGWIVDAVGGMHTEGGPGAGQLHRLARVTENGADRLLETDESQITIWVAEGFKDEGVVGFVADSAGPGGAAVIQYRKGERRLWVISPKGEANAEKGGWARAGIHFWLWPRGSAKAAPVAKPAAKTAAQS